MAPEEPYDAEMARAQRRTAPENRQPRANRLVKLLPEQDARLQAILDRAKAKGETLTLADIFAAGIEVFEELHSAQ